MAYYDDRVVIHAGMREKMMERIYLGHKGITKCSEVLNCLCGGQVLVKRASKVLLCQFRPVSSVGRVLGPVA